MATMPSKSELRRNLKQLHERLDENPMDLDARMRVARTFRLLSKAGDAVKHYAAVARYLSLAGHPLQAIAVLKELLQVDPAHQETLFFLAKLYARTRAADTSNRGRVAVPIFEPGQPLATLDTGIPLTTTGIWRAIAPMQPEELAQVKEAYEIGAEIEDDGDDEEVGEGDVLDARTDPGLRPPSGLATPSGESAARSAGPFGFVPDGGAHADAILDGGYEVLGQMNTGDVLLPQVPLFSSLSPAAFVQLSQAMVHQRAKASATLFEQGAPGDSCIVFARGRALVWRTGPSGERIELQRLGEGDLAGVFALMSAQTRQASISALTDVEYFEIDRAAVDALLASHPQMQATLDQFFRERLIASVLATLPVVQSLEVEARHAIAGRFVERSYAAGDELFFEGGETGGLWVVLSGRVRIGHDVDGAFVAESELGACDYVGAIPLADRAPLVLSAQAAGETQVALLSHKAFAEALNGSDGLAKMRARFDDAGLLVGPNVFAGNGTVAGRLIRPGGPSTQSEPASDALAAGGPATKPATPPRAL